MLSLIAVDQAVSLLSCFVFKEGGDKDNSANVRENMQVCFLLAVHLLMDSIYWCVCVYIYAQVPFRQLQAIARSVARYYYGPDEPLISIYLTRLDLCITCNNRLPVVVPLS